MFFVQVLLQGRDFQKIQLLQLPAALLFSVFIDLWTMWFSGWNPDRYGDQILILLFGCVFLGMGIALEVIPNVLILPGEGVVRTIAGLTGWRFGKVKVGFDLGIVASALAVSLLARGRVMGVREGTIIAALIVGHISSFFIQNLSQILARIVPAYEGSGGAVLFGKNP